MIKPIPALCFIALFLSIYQVNLIDQKLQSYGFNSNIGTHINYGLQAQQWVENQKISLRATPFTDKPVGIIQTVTPPVQIVSHSNKSIIEPAQHMTEPVAPIAKKCQEKCRVLTVGDSIMGDVYYSLQRQLKKEHPDWSIIDAHKVSSGLSKDSYYNWPKVAKKLLEEIKPDYTIMLIGMNDAQGIAEEKQSLAFNTEQWKISYTKRVQAIWDTMSENSQVYWIELPSVKADSFDKRLEVVREIHKNVAHNQYVIVRNLIGTNQQQSFMKYRQADGIHLNAIGADLVAQHIIKQKLSTENIE